MHDISKLIAQLGEQYTLESSLHEGDTFEDWLSTTGYYPFLLSVTSQYSTDLADVIEENIIAGTADSQKQLKKELAELTEDELQMLAEELQALLADFVAHSIHANASLQRTATITEKRDGYYVESEKGKNLGGPYASKEKAEVRLAEVEMFKAMDKQAAFDDPNYEEKQADFIIEQTLNADPEYQQTVLQQIVRFMSQFGNPLTEGIIQRVNDALHVNVYDMMQDTHGPIFVGTGSVASKKSKLVFTAANSYNDVRFFSAIPRLVIWLTADEVEGDGEMTGIKNSTMTLDEKIKNAKERAKLIAQEKVQRFLGQAGDDIQGEVAVPEIDMNFDRIDWEDIVTEDKE